MKDLDLKTALPRVVVSTVYIDALGFYETMVFPGNGSTKPTDYGELDLDRYDTFEAAEAGHAAMVRKWRATP